MSDESVQPDSERATIEYGPIGDAPVDPGEPKTHLSTNPATRRGQFAVTTLTGHQLTLQTVDEQTFYQDARDRYLSQNVFTVASDLRALDRLLFFEVQMFRWQSILAVGLDYDYDIVDGAMEAVFRKNIKETAPLISQIQIDLGLTKSARDKNSHESVGGYITQLQIAAKEHGIRREKQLGKAIELVKELFAVAGAYKRSNENERRKLGFESAEDVIDWVLEVMKPQFDEVDEYFRKNHQRFWLRKL